MDTAPTPDTTTPPNRRRPGDHLRHHPARRRAVARASRSTRARSWRSPSSWPASGVDVIEAGFPIASQGDFESVQAIAKGVLGPDHLRPVPHRAGDVDRCWEAIEPADPPPHPRVHRHQRDAHEAQAAHDPRPGEGRGRRRRRPGPGLHRRRRVLARRTPPARDFDFMCEVLQIAVDNGATTLNIPDTVGFGIPEEYAERLHDRARPGQRRLRHLDPLPQRPGPGRGQLAGRGARRCPPGRVRHQRHRRARRQRRAGGGRDGAAHPRPTTSAASTRGIRSEELARTSRLVSRLTGYPVQYNKAVVGRNAFAHESGIHQHGVLNERTTYEIMDPAAGRARASRKIVLGKHSGRHAFADTLKKMGYDLHGDALNQVFTRFKELADRKVELTRRRPRGAGRRGDGRHRPLPVPAGVGRVPGRLRTPRPKATVVLDHEGEKLDGHRRGRRHGRRRVQGHQAGHRHRRPPHRLHRHLGHRRRRRPRRRGPALRGRRPRACPVVGSPPTWSRRRPGRSSTP